MVVLENLDGDREKGLVVLDNLRCPLLVFKFNAIICVSFKYLNRIPGILIFTLNQMVKFLNHAIDNKVRLLVFIYRGQRLLNVMGRSLKDRATIVF